MNKHELLGKLAMGQSGDYKKEIKIIADLMVEQTKEIERLSAEGSKYLKSLNAIIDAARIDGEVESMKHCQSQRYHRMLAIASAATRG